MTIKSLSHLALCSIFAALAAAGFAQEKRTIRPTQSDVQVTQEPPYFFKPDYFNTRIPAAEKDNLNPVHGGELIVRVPTDEGDMNPLTSTSAQATLIQGYTITDTLMGQDPETLEFVPWEADWWQVQDVILMEDGSELEGYILEMDGPLLNPERVLFQPGAARVTVGRHEIDEEASDLAGGKVVMRDGRSYEGEIEELTYTVRIVTKGEGEPQELDLAQVRTVHEEPPGEIPFDRKGINKHCLWKAHLRPGLSWQDGEPIKPEDFELTFATIMNQYVQARPLQNYFQDMKSVTKEGDRMLRIEFRKPYARSYRIVASLIPLPSHIIDYESYLGDEQAYGEYFNQFPMYKQGDKPMIGNGAYRLTSWAESRMVLERWPDWWAAKADLPYWPKGAPYLDRIVFKVIANNTAALNQLKDGEVHADFDIEPSTWHQSDTQTEAFTKNNVRVKITTPTFVYIGWNEKNPLFQDEEIRKALTMMIPRQKILTEVHNGMGEVVTGPYFVGGPIYDHSIEPIPHDPRQAQRILRRKGWIDRDRDGILDKDGRKFSFDYHIHTARAYHRQVADIIKEEMGKNGVEMNIVQREWAIFVDEIRSQKFDAVRFAWQLNSFDDPDNYQIYHSSQAREGGSNSVSFQDPVVDRLLERIRLEFDYEERVRMNRQLHRILHEKQPYTYMFAFEEPFFYHTKFRGVRFWTNPPGYDLRLWYLDPNYEAAK